MPHVSEHKLEESLLEKITSKLFEVTTGQGGRSSGRNGLAELLTSTEKVMLAKRLAALLMLGRGVSFNQVGEALKMSPSTIARLQLGLESGRYPSIATIVQNPENTNSFLDILEKILSAGLPPIAGKGRWRMLYSNKNK